MKLCVCDAIGGRGEPLRLVIPSALQMGLDRCPAAFRPLVTRDINAA
jgi:hypothetical protein